MHCRAAMGLIAALCLSGCRGSDDDDTAVVQTPAAIALDRDVVLLDGTSVALSAEVLDADGLPIDGLSVTWTSTNGGAVAVDDTGQLTPAAIGSAQITACLDELCSAPALALSADLAADAVLYDDAHVLDLAIAEGQEWGIGMVFDLTLTDADGVSVGDVLVPSGAIPLSGRVQAVDSVADGHRFTAQVVNLGEMFDDFRLDETIEVDTERFETDDAVAAEWDVQRDDAGWFSATPRSNRSGVAGPRGTTCWEDSVGLAGGIDFEARTMALKPSLHLDVAASHQTFERAMLEASVETDLDLEVKGQASFEGKVACKLQLAKFPIPVGALGAVYGPFIEAGVGVELAGKVTLENVGLRVKTKRTLTGRVGLDCTTGTCEVKAAGVMEGIGAQPTGDEVTTSFPSLDNTTFEPAAFAFAYADVKVGPGPIVQAFISSESADALTWDFAGITAGLKQEASLRTAEGQQSDTAFRSKYGTFIELAVGRPFQKTYESDDSGTFWNRVASKLEITIVKFELKEVIDLFKSPSGSWSFDSDTLAEGLVNTATVELTDVTYAGLENVESVVIYRVGDGNLTEEATIARGTDGQTTYTWDYVPTGTDVDTPPTFWAATNTVLGGPLVYELADNARVSFAPPPSSTVERAYAEIRADPSLSTRTALDTATSTFNETLGTAPTSYSEQESTLHFNGSSLSAIDFSAFVQNQTGFDQGRSDLYVDFVLDAEADWTVSGTCSESLSAGKADFQLWNYSSSTPTLISALDPDDEGCPYSDSGVLGPGTYKVSFDARSGGSTSTGDARMTTRFDLF